MMAGWTGKMGEHVYRTIYRKNRVGTRDVFDVAWPSLVWSSKAHHGTGRWQMLAGRMGMEARARHGTSGTFTTKSDFRAEPISTITHRLLRTTEPSVCLTQWTLQSLPGIRR